MLLYLPEEQISLYDSDNAQNLNFNNGNVNNNNFNNSYYVLAVSASSNNGYFTLEEIYKAYYDCRRRKRNKLESIEFEINLEDNLMKLYEDINSRTYEIGISTCFVIFDPKVREIFAANFRDRIVHHLVILSLEDLFEEYFIDSSFSCRKGKGTLAALIKLYENIYIETHGYERKDLYIYKFDYKSFFMSIDKQILFDELLKFINTNYKKSNKDLLLWLIKKIIFHLPLKNCIKLSPNYYWNYLPKNKSLFTVDENKGLPIGNLTSLWFANFYLTDFDRYCISKYGESYVRYADDFAFINEHLKGVYNDLNDYVYSTRKLLINSNKIYIQEYSKGIKFLGAVLKNNRVYISNRTINKLYFKLKYFKCNDHYVASINSYLGLLSHYKSNRYLLKIEDTLKHYPIKFTKTYAISRK